MILNQILNIARSDSNSTLTLEGRCGVKTILDHSCVPINNGGIDSDYSGFLGQFKKFKSRQKEFCSSMK